MCLCRRGELTLHMPPDADTSFFKCKEAGIQWAPRRDALTACDLRANQDAASVSSNHSVYLHLQSGGASRQPALEPPSPLLFGTAKLSGAITGCAAAEG